MMQIRFKLWDDNSDGICVLEGDVKRGVMITQGYALTDSRGKMTEDNALVIYNKMKEILDLAEENDAYEEFCLDLAQRVSDDLDLDFHMIDLQSDETPINLEEYGSYFIFNEDGDITYLQDAEEFDYHTYWDGSNWKTIFFDMDDDPITFGGELYNLDEWNGNSHSCGGNHCHANIYAHKEGYVLVTYSQWQGSLTYAELLETESELENKLEELDRVENLKDIVVWRTEQLK